METGEIGRELKGEEMDEQRWESDKDNQWERDDRK